MIRAKQGCISPTTLCSALSCTLLFHTTRSLVNSEPSLYIAIEFRNTQLLPATLWSTWHTMRPSSATQIINFTFIDLMLNISEFCSSPYFTLGNKAIDLSALGFPTTYLGTIIQVFNNNHPLSLSNSTQSSPKTMQSRSWDDGSLLMILPATKIVLSSLLLPYLLVKCLFPSRQKKVLSSPVHYILHIV